MSITSFLQSSIPVLLSSVFPGLGQWYKREVWKGAAFFLTAVLLIGILGSYLDTETLKHFQETGVPPPNLGLIFLNVMLLFGVLFWSMYDAGRGQPPTRQIDSLGKKK